MQISQLLRHKDPHVVTVEPSASVRDALALLARHRIGALVVSSGDGAVDGIVSERDVVRALHARGAGVLTARVAEIMTTQVDVASPDDHLEQLMRVMTDRRIRHLPVLVDGRLVGVVTIGDVVKSRMDELESDRESLLGYINSSG